MTVAELIAELQNFPSDYNVVTRGFDESGLDDLGFVKLVRMERDLYNTSHCGCHDFTSEGGELCVFIN